MDLLHGPRHYCNVGSSDLGFAPSPVTSPCLCPADEADYAASLLHGLMDSLEPVELVAMAAEVRVLKAGTGAAVEAETGFPVGAPERDSEGDYGRAAGAKPFEGKNSGCTAVSVDFGCCSSVQWNYQFGGAPEADASCLWPS